MKIYLIGVGEGIEDMEKFEEKDFEREIEGVE